MEPIQKSFDSPRLTKSDQLKIETIQHPFSFSNSENTELNNLILTAVNLMGGFGICAEGNYQDAINKLFRNTKEVIEIVADELKALPLNSYLDRWSLVYLLAELKSPHALDIFQQVVEEDMPREKLADNAGEAVMLKTTAIEGMVRIAAEGDSKATALLYKNVYHAILSVKRASVQACIAIEGNNAKDKLQTMLPKNEQYLLNIERKHPSETVKLEGNYYLRNNRTDALPKRSGDSKDDKNWHEDHGDKDCGCK